MFADFLDVVSDFAEDNNLVLCGVMLLVAVFVLSFFYKTFWGRWADRAREDEIYGEPGANIKKKKQLHQQER